MSKSQATETIRAKLGGRSGAKCILEAAKQLFSEHGFDAVTVNSIAKKAGVCQASVIYHFKTKKELYLTVLRPVIKDFSERLDNLENDLEDFPKFLSNFSNAHLDNLMQDEQASRLLLREIMGHGPIESKELAEDVLGDSFNHLVEKLKDGQKRGLLNSDIDPVVTTFLVFGANSLFFQTRDIMWHKLKIKYSDANKFSNKVMDILLQGIMVKPEKR